MEYKKLISTKPLGSIERLQLIEQHGNAKASQAAARCIEKRGRRQYLVSVCGLSLSAACAVVRTEAGDF